MGLSIPEVCGNACPALFLNYTLQKSIPKEQILMRMFHFLRKFLEITFLNYNQAMLTVVIQAGGESRRMGRDKALIPFLGKPLIMHIYERVKSLADEVLITTNHPEDYSFLELPLRKDIVKERGALGGIYTALKSANNPMVAIVACDMPFASPELLSMARDRLIGEQVDAVIPRSEDGLEHLHAVYRRKTCIPAVKWALESGEWKVTSWFSKVELAFIEVEELRIYDPEQIAFWNVNTVEELERAQDYVLSGMK